MVELGVIGISGGQVGVSVKHISAVVGVSLVVGGCTSVCLRSGGCLISRRWVYRGGCIVVGVSWWVTGGYISSSDIARIDEAGHYGATTQRR